MAAVGFTINHIAAVFLPALGDYLSMINYRIPFLMGAGLGIVSLVWPSLSGYLPVVGHQSSRK